MPTTDQRIGLQQRRLRAPLLCLMLVPTLAIAGDAITSDAGPVSVTPAVSSPPWLAAAPADDRIGQVLAAARTAELHRDPHWLTLLHYARGVTGHRSLIDDPTFFLSPQGVRDPWAELEATVRGLFDGRPPDPGEPDPAHPGLRAPVAARYPARTAWLCQRLGIDPTTLPVASDPELDAVLMALRPREVQLVFASGFLSSPASMFGHTLLVVRGGEESQLLAQGINYAAALPPGAFDPFYVVKGLFGVFPGNFSATPYHRKVQEYSDLDQRDLWEYRLSLSPAEATALMQHAWELRGIWSDYWFFDENCSFNLLFLVQAARPGLDLTGHAGAWVLPVDTVRWIADAGLVQDVTWRPSLATRVQGGRASLGDDADLAVALARGEVELSAVQAAVSDAARQAQVLDLAGECLHALAGRRAITQAEYRSRLFTTLKARAALGKQAATPLPATPTRPDHGHRSTRVAVGGGGDNHDQSFATLSLRPALHDLLDPPAGYLSTAQVAMGEVDLRWREGDGVELQQLDVLSLTALNPWESLFRRWSWAVVIGAESVAMGAPDKERLQARVSAEAGYSAQPVDSVLCWALAGGDVRGFDAGKGWAVGPSVTAGAVWSLPGAQILAEGRYTGYVLGEEDDVWSFGVALRAPLTPHVALDAAIERRDRWDVLATEWALRVLWYF